MKFCVPVALFVVLVTGTARAESVREIVIAENSKTTDDTVRYIADLDEGDDWDEDEQERVRQDLVSSGLFKEVEVFAEPHPKGGVKVTILAKDKHSWVIAPTYYNQPTNRGGGLGFGENNLFGENKKLLLYGQLATGDSFFIGAYIDPSIGGTAFHWQFDVFLQNERIIEYAPPKKWLEAPKPVRQTKLRYLNSGLRFGFTLFRSMTLDGRLRGAYVYYAKPFMKEGATVEDLGIAEGDPVPLPGAEGWDVSAEGILKFDRIANWYGVTTGSRFTLTYEKALEELGSEFKYWYGEVSYLNATRYWSRHNLILRGSVGYGKDVPFQHEFTAGGTSQRGFKGAQFRGDFKTKANLEYSVPIVSIKGLSIRGLAFYDTTYTRWLDIEDTDTFRHYLPGSDEVTGLRGFKNSVGLGTRFYIRQIVLPLLGLDVGYGLESGSFETYLAIGLTDT